MMTNFEPEALSLVTERYLKAGHPETRQEELWMLAVDEIDNVRRRVAENPNCPVEILEALAIDDFIDVRIAVAEHPKASIDLLQRLCADENADVRYAMAENPNISEDVLAVLVEDDNPYVSHRAKRTMKVIKPTEVTNLKPRTKAQPDVRQANFGG
jgi:hypothetical protein